jgi:hypothetical protein
MSLESDRHVRLRIKLERNVIIFKLRCSFNFLKVVNRAFHLRAPLFVFPEVVSLCCLKKPNIAPPPTP